MSPTVPPTSTTTTSAWASRATRWMRALISFVTCGIT